MNDISTKGYVIASHEAAIWALWTTDTFKKVRMPFFYLISLTVLKGMIRLLAMGDDVDTVCAIYGQIAGACYGFEAIPEEWLRDMKRQDLLDGVFGTLVEKAVDRAVQL